MTEDSTDFEALELLKSLEQQARQRAPSSLPDKLPWNDIRQEPGLFQARGGALYEPHLSDRPPLSGPVGMLVH